jgi:hypothetical protein
VTDPFREVKLTSLAGFTKGHCRRSSESGRSTSGQLGSDTACTFYHCRTSMEHCGRGLRPLPAAGGRIAYPEVPCLSTLCCSLSGMVHERLSICRSSGKLSGCNRTLQLNLMAPVGHTSTQAPQPQQASAFTLTAVSPSVIASVGQSARQAAHRVHAASTTLATGVG